MPDACVTEHGSHEYARSSPQRASTFAGIYIWHAVWPARRECLSSMAKDILNVSTPIPFHAERKRRVHCRNIGFGEQSV